MNLKTARDKNKLEHFIKAAEKTHPKASHRHFHGTIKSMVKGTAKAKRGASRKASGAS